MRPPSEWRYTTVLPPAVAHTNSVLTPFHGPSPFPEKLRRELPALHQIRFSPDDGPPPTNRHVAFIALNLASNHSAACCPWRFLPRRFSEVAQVHKETDQVDQEFRMVEGVVPDDEIVAHLREWNGVDPITVRNPLLDLGREEVGGHVLC